MLQRWSFATPHVRASFRSKRESSAETCIKILVTECFLQRCERWLAGAVARRNVFDLERIFQSRYRLCDNIVRRDDKVETAGAARKDFSITLIRQARCLLAVVLMPRGAPVVGVK